MGQPGIQCPADHARVGGLRVAQLPGLVHLLARKAQVRDGGWCVPLGNGPLVSLEATTRNLAPLLRGVVLIREPTLGSATSAHC